MARFISLGGYTFNADEVLYAVDDKIWNGREDEPVVRLEFRRKGVIYLKDVSRADVDRFLDAQQPPVDRQ